MVLGGSWGGVVGRKVKVGEKVIGRRFFRDIVDGCGGKPRHKRHCLGLFWGESSLVLHRNVEGGSVVDVGDGVGVMWE